MLGSFSSSPCEAVKVVVSAPACSEPCTAPAAPASLCISIISGTMLVPRSKSATVSGMRSPPSCRRNITKCPGSAERATSGASTSHRNVVSDNASRRMMG